MNLYSFVGRANSQKWFGRCSAAGEPKIDSEKMGRQRKKLTGWGKQGLRPPSRRGSRFGILRDGLFGMESEERCSGGFHAGWRQGI